MQLYTLGYTGVKPEEIIAAAEHLNAVVADIRISPFSRHPQWRGATLAKSWGSRYVHVKTLGNKNYKGEYGEGIMLLDPEEGSKKIGELLKTQPVILLCACEKHESCHRTPAAEEVARRYNANISHLTAEDIRSITQPKPPQQMNLF